MTITPAQPPRQPRTFRVSWQRRTLYAYAAYMLVMAMLDAAALGLWSPLSVSYKAAAMTGMREPLSWAFAACALLMLPFILAQLSPRGYPRWTVLLVCTACFVAALLWMGIAFVAKNADLGVLRWLYVRQSGEASLLMLLVAAHCNAVLRHEYGVTAGSAGFGPSNRVPLE